MRRLFLFYFILFSIPVFCNHYFKYDYKFILVQVEQSSRVKILLHQAKHYIDKGDYFLAKKKLKEAISLDPGNVEAKDLLSKCDTNINWIIKKEKEAYEKACSLGTISALRSFIDNYPNSEFRRDAERRIEDFNLWQKALRINTKKAYEEYLATSTFKSFKKEAYDKIDEFNAEEEWERCCIENSEIRYENFRLNYPNSKYTNEAVYRVALLKGDDFYSKSKYYLAKAQYQIANKIHKLTGRAQERYQEILDMETYERLKGTYDVSSWENFYKSLSFSSPIYDLVSNNLAISKAKKLNKWSSSYEMDLAMGYARDSQTRNIVKWYIDQAQKEKRQYERAQRAENIKEWWSERVRLGWNIFGWDMRKDVLTFDTGLRLRFGKFDDFLNITLGVDYMYWAYINLSSLGDYLYDSNYNSNLDLEFKKIANQIVFPINVKLNMFGSDAMKIYAAVTTEFGLTIGNCNNDFGYINSSTIAIQPQLGFNFEHVDLGVYYKKYLDDWRLIYDGNVSDDERWGMFFTVYF